MSRIILFLLFLYACYFFGPKPRDIPSSVSYAPVHGYGIWDRGGEPLPSENPTPIERLERLNRMARYHYDFENDALIRTRYYRDGIYIIYCPITNQMIRDIQIAGTEARVKKAPDYKGHFIVHPTEPGQQKPIVVPGGGELPYLTAEEQLSVITQSGWFAVPSDATQNYRRYKQSLRGSNAEPTEDERAPLPSY